MRIKSIDKKAKSLSQNKSASDVTIQDYAPKWDVNLKKMLLPVFHEKTGELLDFTENGKRREPQIEPEKESVYAQ